MNRALPICLGLWLLALRPHPAEALTTIGFQHARPQTVQRAEVGGGVSHGDDFTTGFGGVRFGLLDELEAQLRIGVIEFYDRGGFEVEGGFKQRFLREADTRAVDLAVSVQASVLKTQNIAAFGLDPTLIASHHFRIAPKRALVLGLSLGMALTLVDFEGHDDELEFGLIGAFSAGVDIVQHVRLALELGLRDDQTRGGVAVTYAF